MPTDTDPTSPTLVSRRTLEIATALATALFGAAIIFGALEFPVGWSDRGPDPGYFPFWIGCLIIAGSLGALIEALLRKDIAGQAAITAGQGWRALVFIVPMLAFLAVTQFGGIYLATLLYLFFVMTVQGGYRILTSAATAIGTVVFFYLVFDRWLKVPLAKGPIEAWLGLH